MTLTSALHIASSGLGAAALKTGVTSQNIANADRPGFTRKAVGTVTTASGQVKAGRIDRSVDAMLTRLDRTGKSRLAAHTTVAEGISAYTNHLGQPTDATSPAAHVEKLRSALVTLSGFPDQEAAQLQVVSMAKAAATNLRSLSGTLDTVAREVDLNLRYDVTAVNGAMQELAQLNRRVGIPADPLDENRRADRMAELVDTVAEYMDIQTVTTGEGVVNLYTGSGVELVVRDRVFDVAYDGAAGTLRAGAVDITLGLPGRGVTGGTLAGLLELNNRVVPGFRDQLDGMAAALVQGFETANPIAPGGTGLFTDAGGVFSAALQPGLAARIAVNAALDPDLGGDPALLQSGGMAGVPASDPTRIDAMVQTFSQVVSVDTGGLGTTLTLADLAPTLVGSQQALRANADGAAITSRTASETVSAARANFEGVNIDDEMQKLLLVQQSYAANAKVLTTVTNMLDTLLAAV
ncbi:flagellar hook-associated protein FlgK [Marivita sp.]|uniref:flagellar hook-associated protein FlgK n=1 Tax=Marivita sp. TaxID=2003365 RepID=UPI0025C02010|nr:flagellar hook-associated protein FlgK [Marivita sp.]